MRGRGMGWVAVWMVASSVGVARADVVSPPPERCPTGSEAVEFCHGPPTCRALTCETDADCGTGFVCRDERLCTAEYCCSGRLCGDPSAATIYTHVFGPCDSAGGCADFGAACTMEKVCVPGTNGDAGSTGTDGGSTGEDAGRRDAGGASTDAGRRDAGGTRVDAGGRRDAGTIGTTAGGCCSVADRRGGALGGVLFALALAIALARRR